MTATGTRTHNHLVRKRTLNHLAIPEERKQNLAETDKGSYYNQEEWVEEFLDNKGAFYNTNESDDSDNDDENYNENMEAVIRRCPSK